MENRGYKGWGIKKLDNRPVRVLMKDCPDPKLYAKAYNMYVGGYMEEEVAEHLGVPVREVERAIQHTRSCLSSRTIISHNNDRGRILIQRTEGKRYREMLAATLSIPAEQYLAAGITPVGPMKEYREAVGMVERPGAISLSLSQNVSVTEGKVTSFEDLLRRVITSREQGEGRSDSVPAEKQSTPIPELCDEGS